MAAFGQNSRSDTDGLQADWSPALFPRLALSPFQPPQWTHRNRDSELAVGVSICYRSGTGRMQAPGRSFRNKLYTCLSRIEDERLLWFWKISHSQHQRGMLTGLGIDSCSKVAFTNYEVQHNHFPTVLVSPITQFPIGARLSAPEQAWFQTLVPCATDGLPQPQIRETRCWVTEALQSPP